MFHVKHFATIVALGLALTGCAELQKFESGVRAAIAAHVSMREAYVAAEAFDAVKVTATNYLRLRRCNGSNGPVCRDQNVTPQIVAAVRSGTTSRNQVVAYLRAHQADGPNSPVGNPAEVNALTAAINTIEAATAAYQAAKGS